MTSRLLGVDLGTKRIGLAVADVAVGIARPFSTITRAGTSAADATTLRRICDEQRVDEVVVGLPLEASGAEGTMSTAARLWASEIEPLIGRPVVMRDERLSSYEAEQRIGALPRGRAGVAPTRAKRNAHRARIDREAASVILQDELEARLSAARSAPVSGATPPREDE
jgi:putative holliday junction resolvase